MPIKTTPRPIPLYAFNEDPDLPGDPFLEPDEAQAEAAALVGAMRTALHEAWGEGGEGALGDPVFEWCPGICAIAIHPLQAVVRVAVGWFRRGDREKVAREVLNVNSLLMEGDKSSPRAPAPSAREAVAEMAREVPDLRKIFNRIELVEKVLGGMGGGPYGYE
jgi:hypothetical protein